MINEVDMFTGELTLRIVGVTLLGLLTWLMLRARRRDPTARIGAALCLSVAAFLLTSMQGAQLLLGVFVYPLSAICATHPVWFWLFCSALFADRFRLTRRHAVLLAAMALVGSAYESLAPAAHAQAAFSTQVIGLVFGLASLAFVCAAPFAVHVGRRADLDERRLKIRAWFVPLVSAYLAAVVFVRGVALVAAWPTPKLFVVANLIVIDVVAALALLTFVQVRVHNWLDLVEPSPAAHLLSRAERNVLDRLTRRFVPERLYAREGLSIAMLAELLETQEHILRRVINRGLGFRNFNDFLHSHRLPEVGARLRDPSEQRVPVLTIALEAGYGSIGPFNRAFRERFGTTPTQYRRAALQRAGDHSRRAFDGEPSTSAPV